MNNIFEMNCTFHIHNLYLLMINPMRLMNGIQKIDILYHLQIQIYINQLTLENNNEKT